MGNGFGSGEASDYQVNEYQNPLNVQQMDAKPWANLLFTPALSADGRNVEMRLDVAAVDGNPLWRERDALMKDGFVAIVEGAYVVFRKNSTGVPLTLELRNLFSMPAGGRLTAGVPSESKRAGGGIRLEDGSPDPSEMVELLNKLTISLPPTDETVVLKGDNVYHARAKYEAHKVWAGMDRAFDPTRRDTGRVTFKDEDEDDDGEKAEAAEPENTPKPPTVGREFFKDSHPVIRALRMYRSDLQFSKSDWKIVKSKDGQHVSHNLSADLANRIRILMQNTYLKQRRYTQFTETTAAVRMDPDTQVLLNTKYLEHLKNAQYTRPVVQAVVLLRVINFNLAGRDPEYQMIQLE